MAFRAPLGLWRNAPASIRRLGAPALVSLIGTVLAPSASAAQYEIGVSIGGASSLAVVLEHRWGSRGVEVQAGMLGLSSISLSATARQYIGSRAVQPSVGAGLWLALSKGSRIGAALIGRAPIDVSWRFRGAHALRASVYLNRAFAIRRKDAEDTRPPRSMVLPLPEFSYRWMSRRENGG